MIIYTASDGDGASYSSRHALTDASGRCTVAAYAPVGKLEEARRRLERSLAVQYAGDLPRGPISADLATDRVAVVRLSAPGSVAGTFLDCHGLPVRGYLTLRYHRPGGGSWEVDGVAIAADCHKGRFSVGRIGQEPLHLVVRARGFKPYESEPLQPEPGEIRFVRVVLERDSVADGGSRKE